MTMKLRNLEAHYPEGDKRFNPVDLTIHIESESELRALWAIFNAPNHEYEKYGDTVGAVRADFEDLSTKYWSIINQIAYKAGMVKTQSYLFTKEGEDK